MGMRFLGGESYHRARAYEDNLCTLWTFGDFEPWLDGDLVVICLTSRNDSMRQYMIPYVELR